MYGTYMLLLWSRNAILFQLAVSMDQARTACFRVTVLVTVIPQEAALMKDTLVRVSVIRILLITMVKYSQDHNVRLVSFINTAAKTQRIAIINVVNFKYFWFYLRFCHRKCWLWSNSQSNQNLWRTFSWSGVRWCRLRRDRQFWRRPLCQHLGTFRHYGFLDSWSGQEASNTKRHNL